MEQYASATGIVKNALELKAGYPQSALAESERITSLNVYEAAKEGDTLAAKAFEVAGAYLGSMIAGLVNALNPEVVVVGGGASNGWDFFIEETRRRVDKMAFERPAKRVKLLRASVGDTAGVIGAAKLASEHGRETAPSAL